ncbi:MAG: insulinase family protein [Syntrophaceae bacterium]|nr:insulinase family protein [Syntrophaceae bacterium]
MRISKKYVIFILIFLPFVLLSVTPLEAGLGEQVFETVLPNGLKVIFLQNPKAPLVTFQVWYRVGSRNEPWEKTGLSHLLEHMMFKGTEKTGPEEFSRIIQENGGNLNAFTSYDYTAYFENLSSDRIRVAIDLEADRMQNLVLREEDFRTERMVVMEERRLRTEDNPQTVLIEQVMATAFQIHPYRWPIIGWMEDLERLTLDDLKAYYRTYYNPVNAFLIVVGDFKREELLTKIEQAFGPIPKGTAPDQEKSKEPPQMGERRIFVKKEAQLPSLVMGYHVPNLRHPDGYVLEVIATLLSEGKSSRLYQNLVREKRLALSADSDYSLLSRDPRLFFLWVDLLPNKEVADVERTLDQEIERLQREPVGDQELEKAKNQLEASFIFGQDSIFNQAMLLARYEMTLSWKAIDDYLPSIRKVTPEDIRRVAQKYLVPDNRTVGILVPLPPKEGKPGPERSSIKEHIVR